MTRRMRYIKIYRKFTADSYMWGSLTLTPNVSYIPGKNIGFQVHHNNCNCHSALTQIYKSLAEKCFLAATACFDLLTVYDGICMCDDL